MSLKESEARIEELVRGKRAEPAPLSESFQPDPGWRATFGEIVYERAIDLRTTTK